MNPMMLEKLLPVASALAEAGHGQMGAIKQQACAELGISLATLHKLLDKVRIGKPRKKRSDAGTTNALREELLLLSGVMLKAARANDKQLYALCDVVPALRDNGLVKLEKVNKRTGEVTPLSISAISRALYKHGLHPSQLTVPTPHITIATLHPNHMWEIDASLCVLYYLRPKAGDNGLRMMKRDEFYKNKPKNIAKIAADRVWSYEITDHASGWIYVEYVLGAESGENLCNVLMNAMTERGNGDLLHGVPRILYMDPGSANTSAMAKNLCRALGIQAIAHAAGNARATGQVEQARNLIERKFEAGLRFRPVADLDELNALAAQWRIKFNATAVHTRHKMTRSEAWMHIKADQLVKAPPISVMRELAIATPEERKVRPNLRVSFGGVEYDVSTVPNVRIGEKLLVTRNPWRSDAAQVVLQDEHGRDVFHLVAKVEQRTFGYAADAPIAGEGYKQHAASHQEKVLEEIEQLMMGDGGSDIPLQGRFNPYKTNEDFVAPAYLPRRGTEHTLTPPVVTAVTLTPLQIAKGLAARMGDAWQPDFYSWVAQHYADGAPEDQLDAIADRLTRRRNSTLRAVGGDQ